MYSPSFILKGLVIQYSINFSGNFSITGVGSRTSESGFKVQTAENPNEHFSTRVLEIGTGFDAFKGWDSGLRV